METNTKILAAEFQYLEGQNLDQVLSWLATYREKARVLAGGTDLLVKMKLGHVQPEYIIFIKKIASLGYIQLDASNLKIGATTTLSQIERHEAIKGYYSALYEAVHSMAAVAVKNMGTIGGNLGNASPAADTAPPLLVYDASLKIASQDGVREIPITEYFLGPGKSALAPNELLLEISIPKIGADTGSSFLKLGRVAADIAKINVAVCLKRSGRTCTSCRIAFGSVAPTPVRVQEAESLLEGKELNEDLITLAAKAGSAEIKPITDNRSTREYRLKVSRVMLEEALRAAWQRAGGVL
ncbi:FAD-binding, type 2 [Moorella glycerini]|uniref:Carbon monoxide dehydrogenase medium chain n=1 Tax=Neomoorella stamsii TaxID=1266720 RepID=A0A9X7J2Z2_9FIRM|nr:MULTISPECIES: xanthine dehydrogenase family protein subunit M [Moorella]PRR73436.1 Carbon monoxide dehydrogenase medium chain [Moorella stamsii]CEP69205.1 FAD-binding, type 2 [Moorella glycerini]